MKEIFDEGILAEQPGEYCYYCGAELKTEEEKEEGICESCWEIMRGKNDQ